MSRRRGRRSRDPVAERERTAKAFGRLLAAERANDRTKWALLAAGIEVEAGAPSKLIPTAPFEHCTASVAKSGSIEITVAQMVCRTGFHEADEKRAITVRRELFRDVVRGLVAHGVFTVAELTAEGGAP